MDSPQAIGEQFASDLGVPYEALQFIFANTNYAQRYYLKVPDDAGNCHISAFGFCCAFMGLAKLTFGDDYAKVLRSWNLDTSEKLGAIVIALIEKSWMKRQDNERRSDFDELFYID